MHKIAGGFLAILFFCLPLSATALELIAPMSECTLTETRVRVIGLASGASKGKVSFLGKSTSFRVQDGHFNVALNLGEGTHEVKFLVGDEELVARWTVDPSADSGAFKYHPELRNGECRACHDADQSPLSTKFRQATSIVLNAMTHMKATKHSSSALSELSDRN